MSFYKGLSDHIARNAVFRGGLNQIRSNCIVYAGTTASSGTVFASCGSISKSLLFSRPIERNHLRFMAVKTDLDPKGCSGGFFAKMRSRMKSYGKVGLVVYISTSLFVTTCIFISLSIFDQEKIRAPFDYVSSKIPFFHHGNPGEEHGEGFIARIFKAMGVSSLGPGVSVFLAKLALAVAISKLFTPIKLLFTILVTPVVIRYGRRMKYRWALPSGQLLVDDEAEPMRSKALNKRFQGISRPSEVNIGPHKN